MTQLRAQLAEVNRQNTELRSQNRELLWQVQQVKQQQPPLRASTANDHEELHRQVYNREKGWIRKLLQRKIFLTCHTTFLAFIWTLLLWICSWHSLLVDHDHWNLHDSVHVYTISWVILYNYYPLQTDALREQHAEAMRENHILRSRVEILTHQVYTMSKIYPTFTTCINCIPYSRKC